jgi:hypothetical protein
MECSVAHFPVVHRESPTPAFDAKTRLVAAFDARAGLATAVQ